MIGRATALALALALGACATTVADRSPTLEAVLPSGAVWSAELPVNWNGTLLLHSRGYSPVPGHPEAVPERYREALLAGGYALAASNYGSGGWSLAEAVPAQEATIAAFSARYGKPRRVIGYGFSMGGLVTTALAEKAQPAIDGGIALCSSMDGSSAMMNMGLDGAFAFRTLLAPDSAIELVNVADDRANAALALGIVQGARASAAGRARLALAATLAGIPAWVPEISGESSAERDGRELEILMAAIPMGVFLPRQDQEARAGGNASSNVGADYAALLLKSGRMDFVQRLYAAAGIDLAADLAALQAAPRVAADSGALRYMLANYDPTRQPTVPLLALQALGDTVTSPSLQYDYAARADDAMFQSLYVAQSGHCTFTAGQIVEAIRRVEMRLDTGRWPAPTSMHSHEQPAPLPRGD